MLSDEKKRLDYDSQDDFTWEIPKGIQNGDFYSTFAGTFLKLSK